MSFYYAIKILLLKFFYGDCDIGIIYTYLIMLKSTYDISCRKLSFDGGIIFLLYSLHLYMSFLYFDKYYFLI